MTLPKRMYVIEGECMACRQDIRVIEGRDTRVPIDMDVALVDNDKCPKCGEVLELDLHGEYAVRLIDEQA